MEIVNLAKVNLKVVFRQKITFLSNPEVPVLNATFVVALGTLRKIVLS